jgi:hypothetical protein
MSDFSKEIVDALEAIKKSGSEGQEHSKEDMETLFLASLLEEENNGRC